MNKIFTKGALALVLASALGLSAALPARAASQNTNFQVSITVTNTCDVSSFSATNLGFGSHTFLDTNVTANSSISVKCTSGAPYEIALNAGSNPATPGDVSTRRMLNGTSNYVAYDLFQDAAATQEWGDTSGTNTVSGTGNGAVQNYNVYGKVASVGSVPAGTYTDTVQATVTY